MSTGGNSVRYDVIMNCSVYLVSSSVCVEVEDFIYVIVSLGDDITYGGMVEFNSIFVK